MLIAAALALSGCWGKAFGPPDGQQFLVIYGDVTDRVILDSTVRCGTGYSRGACALDTIRALCWGIPITEPVTAARCLSITWEDHRNDIEAEIRRVIGPNADCLAAHLAVPGPPYWDWVSLPLNAYGCTRAEQLPGTR